MRSPIVPNGQPGPHDIPNLWTVPFPCALIVFSVGDRRHQRQPSAPSSRSPSSVSRSRLNWQIPSQSCGTRHINLANPFALVIQPDRQRHALPIGDHLHRPGHRDWQVGKLSTEDRRAAVVVVLINRIIGVETAAVVVWRRSPAEMGGKWSFASTLGVAGLRQFRPVWNLTSPECTRSPQMLSCVVSPPSAVSEARLALRNFYNITIRIANVAEGLAVIVLWLCDKHGSSISP